MTQTALSSETQRYNVLGVEMEFLAGPDETEADMSLVSGALPPSLFIPLHRHESPEVLYTLEGTIDVYQADDNGGTWAPLPQGEVVVVRPNVWHALKNNSAKPTKILAFSQAQLWHFFHALGRPFVPNEPPAPPSPEVMQALFEAASRFRYEMGTPQQNATIGLNF